MWNNRKAPLIVLSGPSGVGKSTVVSELLARGTLPLRRGITATTREPRTGEVDRKDYHFWTVAQFQDAVTRGQMLEHALVHDRDYYGTPRDEVDVYRDQGIGVILVIDVQGAAQVRSIYPQDHLSIFLTVPDEYLLRDRLIHRGTETEEKISRRLKTARNEWQRSREFDKIIQNLDLKTAVDELEQAIQAEYRHPSGKN